MEQDLIGRKINSKMRSLKRKILRKNKKKTSDEF